MSVAALALLLALSAGGDPAPPLFDQQGRALGRPPSDRVVDYAIEARLDPAAGTLEGRERLTWRNRSREPQRTLSPTPTASPTSRSAPPPPPPTAPSTDAGQQAVAAASDLMPASLPR